MQSVFPMISVRNPWGFLIQNGFKKIENRKQQLSEQYINTWVALHVSKTFKRQEDKYAHKYLKNHQQLLEKSTNSTKQSALTQLWGTPLKLTDTQKISSLIDNELKPQMGHIIAFIKISSCVTSAIGKTHDALYCDQPFRVNSHWVISDVIPLQKNEYFSARGHIGCAKISSNALNTLLSNVLSDKLQKRENKPECQQKQTETIVDDEGDDDILDIMTDLDNATATQQISQDRNDSLDIDILQFNSPKSKKRKRKEIVNSDDDINDDVNGNGEIRDSPPPKKRKLPTFVTGENCNNMNRFEKFSRNNSLYDMKRNENKIDLMIQTQETNNNHTGMNSDIDVDAELEATFAEKMKKEKLHQNKNKLSLAMQEKLYSNPKEMRRKAHLSLPDQYKHRIIVFDTETACFKPEGVIIEIGAVELINGKLTGRKFQSYIKPWAKIHDGAMKVHGITERFLEKYADGDIYEIIQAFMEWICSDCICSQCKNLQTNQLDRKHKVKLIGHNVVFDVRQLNGAMNYCQANVEHKIWQNIEIESTFDTLIYYRTVLGNVSNYSLDGMCLKFGIGTDARKHSHGALVDAMVTAKCLQEMWRRAQDVKDRKCKNRFFTKKL